MWGLLTHVGALDTCVGSLPGLLLPPAWNCLVGSTSRTSPISALGPQLMAPLGLPHVVAGTSWLGHGSSREDFTGNGINAMTQDEVFADSGCDLPTVAAPTPPAPIRTSPRGEGLHLFLPLLGPQPLQWARHSAGF